MKWLYYKIKADTYGHMVIVIFEGIVLRLDSVVISSVGQLYFKRRRLHKPTCVSVVKVDIINNTHTRTQEDISFDRFSTIRLFSS